MRGRTISCDRRDRDAIEIDETEIYERTRSRYRRQATFITISSTTNERAVDDARTIERRGRTSNDSTR